MPRCLAMRGWAACPDNIASIPKRIMRRPDRKSMSLLGSSIPVCSKVRIAVERLKSIPPPEVSSPWAVVKTRPAKSGPPVLAAALIFEGISLSDGRALNFPENDLRQPVFYRISAITRSQEQILRTTPMLTPPNAPPPRGVLRENLPERLLAATSIGLRARFNRRGIASPHDRVMRGGGAAVYSEES